MPSSVVRHFSYDAERRVLRIEYVSGNIYDYLGVPEKVFDEMKEAGSKGTFLNNVIKVKYAFKRVR
jgi:hypothetical protein